MERLAILIFCLLALTAKADDNYVDFKFIDLPEVNEQGDNRLLYLQVQNKISCPVRIDSVSINPEGCKNPVDITSFTGNPSLELEPCSVDTIGPYFCTIPNYQPDICFEFHGEALANGESFSNMVSNSIPVADAASASVSLQPSFGGNQYLFSDNIPLMLQVANTGNVPLYNLVANIESIGGNHFTPDLPSIFFPPPSVLNPGDVFVYNFSLHTDQEVKEVVVDVAAQFSIGQTISYCIEHEVNVISHPNGLNVGSLNPIGGGYTSLDSIPVSFDITNNELYPIDSIYLKQINVVEKLNYPGDESNIDRLFVDPIDGNPLMPGETRSLDFWFRKTIGSSLDIQVDYRSIKNNVQDEKKQTINQYYEPLVEIELVELSFLNVNPCYQMLSELNSAEIRNSTQNIENILIEVDDKCGNVCEYDPGSNFITAADQVFDLNSCSVINNFEGISVRLICETQDPILDFVIELIPPDDSLVTYSPDVDYAFNTYFTAAPNTTQTDSLELIIEFQNNGCNNIGNIEMYTDNIPAIFEWDTLLASGSDYLASGESISFSLFVSVPSLNDLVYTDSSFLANNLDSVNFLDTLVGYVDTTLLIEALYQLEFYGDFEDFTDQFLCSGDAFHFCGDLQGQNPDGEGDGMNSNAAINIQNAAGGVGGGGGNDGGIGGGGGGIVMPVELIQFEGKKTALGNDLYWSTAAEINNAYFELSRSFDGKTFERISHLKGNGTTSLSNHYAVTDADIKSGTTYYKLVQVDFDGTVHDCGVLSLTRKSEIFFEIYPNPVVSTISISGDIDFENVTISLTDLSGKNMIVNHQIDRVDVSELKPGLYVLKVTDKDCTVSTKRFIKN